MFILGNFLIAIAKLVDSILTIYMWIIIIRALISWVNPDPYNAIVQFLNRITEPVLRPIRYLLPTYRLGIDLSPLVVILIILFIKEFLIVTIIDIARRLR